MNRWWLGIVVLALLALASCSIFAAPLPPLENYISTEAGPCIISVPKHNAGLTGELGPVCRERFAEIFEQLGQKRDPGAAPVEVRVVGHPAEMKEMVPADAAPPEWAAAVAYPQFNLVVLSLNHRNGSPVQGLRTVFEHELSHLAMRQALGSARVPRWFSEGVAIHQSERSSLSRYWILWTSVKGGNLLPLAEIERYPSHSGQVDLAYAQAADFMAFLLRQEGWLGVRIVLRQMAKGETFQDAFALAFRDSERALDNAWRAGLTRRWHWVPLLTGTGAVWGFIVILFLVAYAAVTRREKIRLAQMEQEEAAFDYLESLERDVSTNQLHGPDPSEAKSSTKIRIDGDIYTLH
jgi:hypothetical protein